MVFAPKHFNPWAYIDKNISIPMGAAGPVYYCYSLTRHDMLRLPRGGYEITPESQV